MFKEYLAEIADPTLLLGLLCALLGIAAAAHHGSINVFDSALVVVSVLLAQMAINLMDDYQDYLSGMDKKTIKTRFSGGSKLVVSGKVYFKHVLWLAMAFALLGAAIGVYLALTINMLLLVIMAMGAIMIFFYNEYLTKFPLFAEPVMMICFAFIGVGSFIVAHGSLNHLGGALFAIVPAGILCGIVLLVNEVPDAKIDEKYGIKHAVVVLKDNRKVAAYYLLLMFITYAIVAIGIIVGPLSIVFFAILVTLPGCFSIAAGIEHYKTPLKFERFMASNMVLILLYLTILIVAYSF